MTAPAGLAEQQAGMRRSIAELEGITARHRPERAGVCACSRALPCSVVERCEEEIGRLRELLALPFADTQAIPVVPPWRPPTDRRRPRAAWLRRNHSKKETGMFRSKDSGKGKDVARQPKVPKASRAQRKAEKTRGQANKVIGKMEADRRREERFDRANEDW